MRKMAGFSVKTWSTVGTALLKCTLVPFQSVLEPNFKIGKISAPLVRSHPAPLSVAGKEVTVMELMRMEVGVICWLQLVPE